MKRHQLTELVVENGDFKITLRTGSAEQPEAQARGRILTGKAPHRKSGRPTAVPINSPLLGIFYRAPAPDRPPFVEVGDLIRPGDTIGLVEAMKVMNDITAEIGGRVVELAAENGQLVNEGDPLILVAPFSAAEASGAAHPRR